MRWPLKFLLIFSLAVATPAGAQQSSDVEKAQSLFKQGKLGQAQAILEKATESGLNDKWAYFYLGEIYSAQGMWKEAAKAYKRATKIDRRFKEAWNGYGKTLLHFDWWGNKNLQASYQFKKALSIDRWYLEARINLGRAYYAAGREYEARREWKRAIKLGGEDPSDAYFAIGWQYFESQEYGEAIKSYRQGLKYVGNDPQPLLDMAVIYLADQQYEKAQETFEQAFALLPPTERALYDDLRYLMSPEKWQEFQSLPIERQGEISNEIWHDLDPDWNTEMNEGRLEHWALVRLARKFYGPHVFPWDPRGDELLSQGSNLLFPASSRDMEAFRLILTDEEREELDAITSPKERARWIQRYWKDQDPTPTTQVNERRQEHERRVAYARKNYAAPTKTGFDDRGRIYIRFGEPDDKWVRPMGSLQTKGNESWSYDTIARGLVFDFVEYGGIYREVPDLRKAVMEGNPLAVARQMYSERMDISPAYARLVTDFDFEWALGRMWAEREVAKNEAPAVVTRFAYKTGHLPFDYAYARFREGVDRTRLEVYTRIRFRDLKFQPLAEGFRNTTVVEMVLLDDLGREVWKRSKQVRMSAKSPAETESGSSIDQENLVVKPGRYTLAIQMQDLESEKVGIYKNALTIDSFGMDTLMLSDLQLAYRIAEQKSGDRFVKNGLQVVPYPYYTVSRRRPLFLYYEIYNLLLNDDGKASYQVSHEVRLKKGGVVAAVLGKRQQESLTITAERQGDETTAIEHISLDFSRLGTGKAELLVRVKDLTSGQVAERRVNLKLVD